VESGGIVKCFSTVAWTLARLLAASNYASISWMLNPTDPSNSVYGIRVLNLCSPGRRV